MEFVLSGDLKLLKAIGLRFSQTIKRNGSFLYQVLNVNIKGNNLGHSRKNHPVTSVTNVTISGYYFGLDVFYAS